MSDLIERRAAIEAVYDAFCYAYCDNCEKEMNEDLCGDCHRKYQNWSASKKIIEKVINNLPPVQPERKKGKWTIDRDCEGKTRYITCNICGHKEFNWYNPNFCPNCGADMRGE